MQIHCKYSGIKGFINLYEYALRYSYMITNKAKHKAKILSFWERMKRSQTFYFIRPYDEKDKKIGVPEKFIGHPRFGVVEVSYYFWDRDDTIPRKISLQTSAGWEFSFSGCRRDYLAMEKVEEALISDGHYKIIYKCIDEVEGFETEAEEKAREKNSLNTFLSLRFAGRL